MDNGSRLPLTEEGRPLARVSDDDLLLRLAEILAQSRRVETDLVAHIAEVDERRLYARQAFPSMFAYCTQALHLSEAEAYLRIAVARASRAHPMILPMLGDGRLHLSGIAQLAPYLTEGNREALLWRATHRSKRQIEELIAEVAPREDEPPLMRKLPDRPTRPETTPTTPSGMGRTVTPSPVHLAEGPQGSPTLSRPPEVVPPLPAPVVRPLAPGRYKVQFTASAELHEKVERLRALLRSRVPDGDLGAILEVAVTETLARLEARRFATTSHPRKTLPNTDTSAASRHVPAAVRRAVRERDGYRCRYVDETGRRCDERYRLEYHHVHPFGFGGDHRPENIRLMCRAHNAYLAEHDYGREAMAPFSRRGTRAHGAVAVASARMMPGPARPPPPGS
jgi:hypothetical protein